MKKTLIQGLLLSLSVCVSFYLVIFQNAIDMGESSLSHYPDSFMKNVFVTHTDKQGNLESKFFTVKMLHYVDDDTVDISTPRIVIYLPDKPPWHVTANYGRAYHGIEKIKLWDHVHCHQPSDKNTLETTLSTTAVTLFPKLKQFETDQPVVATQPGNRIDAVGLRGNLNQGTLELLSQVRGQYVSNKTP